jgi:hypothetical protein
MDCGDPLVKVLDATLLTAETFQQLQARSVVTSVPIGGDALTVS